MKRAYPSKGFDGLPHHLIVDLDIALRGRQVLVASERHNDLGRSALVRKLRDEPATAAVA